MPGAPGKIYSRQGFRLRLFQRGGKKAAVQKDGRFLERVKWMGKGR